MADGGETILRIEKSPPAPAPKMIVVPSGTMPRGATPTTGAMAYEQAYRERQAWDRHVADKLTLGISVALAVFAAALLAAAWRHRRRLARAADEAAVSTLAAGVKAKRAVAGKASTYRQRIIDRAGED